VRSAAVQSFGTVDPKLIADAAGVNSAAVAALLAGDGVDAATESVLLEWVAGA
jgi:hypothetical protein